MDAAGARERGHALEVEIRDSGCVALDTDAGVPPISRCPGSLIQSLHTITACGGSPPGPVANKVAGAGQKGLHHVGALKGLAGRSQQHHASNNNADEGASREAGHGGTESTPLHSSILRILQERVLRGVMRERDYPKGV